MLLAKQDHTSNLTLESLLDENTELPAPPPRRLDVLQALEGCCAAAVVAALSGASAVAQALVGGVLAMSGLVWLVSLSAAGRLQSWQPPVGGESNDY